MEKDETQTIATLQVLKRCGRKNETRSIIGIPANE
jgi:hypothetical protein